MLQMRTGIPNGIFTFLHLQTVVLVLAAKTST